MNNQQIKRELFFITNKKTKLIHKIFHRVLSEHPITRDKVYQKKIFKMPNITIDGKSYDSDSLSDKAKEQIRSMQFVNAEIQRLESKLAVFKTASAAYSLALKNEVES